MAPAVRPPLPIDDVLPALRTALRGHSCAVLQAPPGAGKTTRVPLALLDEPWLGRQKIVMLEPRRLAARAAARFMAGMLGESVGETVGHRVRLDTRVGPRTRVEVVTEGVLTRMLQHDPALDGVGAVIFDEFHERSLHADLGLALALQTQSVLRPELRLLVMSATLDGERVAVLLGRAASGPAAPIVTSEGRSWPVEVRWRDQRPERLGVEAAVAGMVREALRAHTGDVLVFLPGAAEIRRVASALAGAVDGDTRVMPLYGNLTQDAQDAAIAPSPPGRRKVVLATTIAETSLTIEGVRVVVDSGLARVPRFSARTGMSRLETARISRAASEQRCGRAGRLGPGVCYRLWPAHEQHHLLPYAPPEIADADLAPLALELSAAGIADPAELLWLDPPPVAAFRQARELLAQLGAIRSDDAGAPATAHGQRMAELPLHPRLAHMVLRGAELGFGGAACDLAALLAERDVLRGIRGGPADADVGLRLEVLRAMGGGSGLAAVHGARVDDEALRRVRLEARSLRATLRGLGLATETNGGDRSVDGHGRAADGRRSTRTRTAGGPPPESKVGSPPSRRQPIRTPAASSERAISEQMAETLAASGLLLALAYPDRLAQRRPGPAPRYVLRNGRGAVLDGAQTLAAEPWLVAAELTGSGQESQIQLAAPVSLEALDAIGELRATRDAELAWDVDAGVVRARVVERLGALVVREIADPAPDPDAVVDVLVAALRSQGLGMLPWSEGAQRLRERLAFLHALDPGAWPAVSDERLLDELPEWLAPSLRGVRRRDDLARIDLGAALLGRLTWSQRALVDELAPTHVEVPSGSRVRVDYADPGAPVLAVRLQEMFGATDTPRVGGGRVPLALHLLSPAHRPVQVTRDLAGFWRGSYFDVRRELRGRYPKHDWPEEPMKAIPTARVRRKG